jgi:putative transcriptional regulator
METMAVRHRLARRGARRGRLGRAGDQAGQLDAHRYGGLAPGGDRRDLAPFYPFPRLLSPLPAPKAMKNRVRTLRMQQSLAQGQLAEAMGVSRQTINSIENERYTPSLPLALALARFFGVTVEEMFGD